MSQALRLIIHLGEPLPESKLEEFSFSFTALGLFFVLPYVLMMWTNGVGASTGMFVPALAVGATGVPWTPCCFSQCWESAKETQMLHPVQACIS